MIRDTSFKRGRVFQSKEIALPYSNLTCETTIGGRKYVTPEGKAYPSITTVLGHSKKQALNEWRKRVGEAEANRISSYASNRGTKLHSLVERYLENSDDIGLDSEMPHIQQGFRAIQPILDTCIDNIRMQEFPLYSDYLGVAGRVDLIAEFNGRLSVIDLKTSSKQKTEEQIESYFMQEAAYAIMFEERTQIPITRLITLMVVDSDPNVLVFEQHRDKWANKLLLTIEEYQKGKHQ